MYSVSINGHLPIILNLNALLRLIRFTDANDNLDAVSSLDVGECTTSRWYSVVRIS